MILETIFLDLSQDLKVDNEISMSEDNDTESSECEITEDTAAKANVAEASESEPSNCETTEDNATKANITESKVTDSSKNEVTKPSESELTEAVAILKDSGFLIVQLTGLKSFTGFTLSSYRPTVMMKYSPRLYMSC